MENHVWLIANPFSFFSSFGYLTKRTVLEFLPFQKGLLDHLLHPWNLLTEEIVFTLYFVLVLESRLHLRDLPFPLFVSGEYFLKVLPHENNFGLVWLEIFQHVLLYAYFIIFSLLVVIRSGGLAVSLLLIVNSFQCFCNFRIIGPWRFVGKIVWIGCIFTIRMVEGLLIPIEEFENFVADEFGVGLGSFGRDFFEVLDGGWFGDWFLFVLIVDFGG